MEPDSGSPGAQAGPPATGDARVDEALVSLGDLAALPVHEHPAIFEQVHTGLREALGSLDSGPDAPGTAVTRGTPATPGGTGR